MAILTRSAASQTVQSWKSAGKVVVFTNGCFDLLHRGHIEYLLAAKSYGDYLVIGLNSDQSVARIKGDDRPLQAEDDRAIILDALKVTDVVVIFNESTPRKLICALQPDIIVKGGDYTEDMIVGSTEIKEWGGFVKTVPFVKEKSTTQLIERIRSKSPS